MSNDLVKVGNTLLNQFVSSIAETVPSNLSKVRVDIVMEGDSVVKHAFTLFKNGNIDHHIFWGK